MRLTWIASSLILCAVITACTPGIAPDLDEGLTQEPTDVLGDGLTQEPTESEVTTSEPTPIPTTVPTETIAPTTAGSLPREYKFVFDAGWVTMGFEPGYTNGDIYVINYDGTDLIKANPFPAMIMEGYTLSPDGTRLLFVSDHGWEFIDGTTPQSNLFVAGLDGSAPIQVTTNNLSNFPDWSPDGVQIVFLVHEPAGNKVYRVNSDGSNYMPLSEQAGYDWWPHWSPDGQHIAYVHMEPDRSKKVLRVIDANTLTTQSFDNANVGFDFDWSPDGRYIAFASDDVDVYVAEPATMSLFNVSNDPANYEALQAWMPGGNQLVYSLWHNELDLHTPSALYLTDPTGTNRSVFLDTPDDDANPRWSPDGTRIVFMTFNNEETGITFNITSASGTQTDLPTAIATFEAVKDFMWWPDGSALSAIAEADGQWGLYRINADGSGQTLVTPLPMLEIIWAEIQE